MKIIKSIKYLKRIVKESKRNGLSINFIPTMGALHLGHIKFCLLYTSPSPRDS